ncbi:unnamed protein product, partial [Symbiodinium pilosum]
VPRGRLGYCRGRASLLNSGLFAFDVSLEHWRGITQMLHNSWFAWDGSKKVTESHGWNGTGIPDVSMATHWDKTQGGLYTYFVQLQKVGHELAQDLVYPSHPHQPLNQQIFTHFSGKSKPCQVNFKGELSDSELAVYLPSQTLWRNFFFNLGLAPSSIQKCSPILIDLGANCGNTLPFLYKT